MRRKSLKTLWGVTTHISAIIYHKLQNFVPYQSLDIFSFILLFDRLIIIFEYSYILMKTLYMREKIAGNIRGCTYKVTIISAANCSRVLNLAPNYFW